MVNLFFHKLAVQFLYNFFFHEEDGIRDGHVTGVQTCALPIYKRIAISMAYNPATKLSRKDYLAYNLWFEVFRRIDEDMLLKFKQRKEKGVDDEEDLSNLPDRSEERRVGKEWIER